MRRFFVTKEVPYADFGGANLAVTPDLLSDGSVGVYVIDDTNKLVLSTAGTETGVTEYVIAMGTAVGGPIVSPPIKIADTAAGFPKGIAPGVSTVQSSFVGYNGTSGDLNTPTIADGDWAEVKLVRTTYGINQQLDKDSFEVSNLTAGASDYDVAVGIVDSVAERDPNLTFIESRAKVNSSTAGTAYSQNVTFTEGSTAVVIASTGHVTTVGDYLRYDGDTYLVTAVADVNNITIDRPYTGATETATAANVLDLGTDPGSIGIEFIAESPEVTFSVAVSGVLEDATVSTPTPSFVAGGSYLAVKKEEDLARAFLGYHDQIDRRRPAPQTNAALGATYDIYRVKALNKRAAAHEMDATFETEVRAAVCFQDGGSNGQATFEAVLEALYGGITLTPA